ncbi:hypothetical protein ACFQV2_03585 [Actinokineospora soli]|uniref:Uncharacterized protein n=1 Tax=Actinokineospora soli TaxID=1048753 RepID=A0ABW2THE8_9PSEU
MLAEAYARPTSVPEDGPSAPVFAGAATVLGQPAAFLLDSRDKDRHGCRIVVGLTETSGVDIDGGQTLDCDELRPVAEGIVATLAGQA